MKSRILFVVLAMSVAFSEGSQTQKKDGAPLKEIKPGVQNPSNSSLNVQKEQVQLKPADPKNIINIDHDQLSSEPTPKVARHLGGKVNRREKMILGMFKMKRPWFSSKIKDGSSVRILKKIKGKPEEATPIFGELVRYSPRSLDTMGLGGMSNMEAYYGNQQVLPTSGTPNSLDHLYLPEFVAKDYMKPIDFNGIGVTTSNNELSSAAPFTNGFENHENKAKNGFRGNPIDINYHSNGAPDLNHNRMNIGSPGGDSGPRHGPFKGPHGNNEEFPHPSPAPSRVEKRRPDSNHQFDGHNPPRMPHDFPPPPHFHEPQRNPHDFPKRDKHDHRNEDRQPYRENHHDKGPPPAPPGPPGSDEIQGDESLTGLLDLARLLQSSEGLPQLLNANSQLGALGGGGGDNNHNNDHFDAPTPGQEGGRGGENYDYDSGRGSYNDRGNYNHNNHHGPEPNGSRGSGGPYNEFHNGPGSGPDGYQGGNGGNFNDFDGPGPENEDGRGNGPYNDFDGPNYNGNDKGNFNNRPNAPTSGYNQGSSKNTGYGGQSNRPDHEDNFGNKGHHFDGPSGHEGGIRGERPRGPYNNNDGYSDVYNSGNSNNNRYNQLPKPQNSSRKPQYGQYDDDGSFYNSQEQFDGSRRPDNTDRHPGSEGDLGDDPYYGGGYDR